MIHFRGQVVLLDIEGTTSSLHYVHDVMFPYVRTNVEPFLREHFEQDDVQQSFERMAQDEGFSSRAEWLPDSLRPEQRQQRVLETVHRLMDADAKTTGLKALQGQIWKAGFQSGALRAHVYDDVPGRLSLWKEAGVAVYIYSSGSIAAQKLFFGHTQAGSLLEGIDGHFDTTTGPKKEEQSYVTIAASIGVSPSNVLFLSDVAAELDAAADAGLQTGLAVRPGNAPETSTRHPTFPSFAEIIVERA